MAHEFPDITAYGSALRFALEAEQACADFAAAAGVVAPDQAWRTSSRRSSARTTTACRNCMAQQGALGDKRSALAGSLEGRAVPGRARR